MTLDGGGIVGGVIRGKDDVAFIYEQVQEQFYNAI
jgi:hypothetical protein